MNVGILQLWVCWEIGKVGLDWNLLLRRRRCYGFFFYRLDSKFLLSESDISKLIVSCNPFYCDFFNDVDHLFEWDDNVMGVIWENVWALMFKKGQEAFEIFADHCMNEVLDLPMNTMEWITNGSNGFYMDFYFTVSASAIFRDFGVKRLEDLF